MMYTLNEALEAIERSKRMQRAKSGAMAPHEPLGIELLRPVDASQRLASVGNGHRKRTTVGAKR